MQNANVKMQNEGLGIGKRKDINSHIRTLELY